MPVKLVSGGPTPRIVKVLEMQDGQIGVIVGVANYHGTIVQFIADKNEYPLQGIGDGSGNSWTRDALFDIRLLESGEAIEITRN